MARCIATAEVRIEQRCFLDSPHPGEACRMRTADQEQITALRAQLAAERALGDRLAEALNEMERLFVYEGATSLTLRDAREALAAHAAVRASPPKETTR